MLTSLLTNLLFIFIVLTIINLIIKFIITYNNKTKNVVMCSYNYSFKNYGKVTHFLTFFNVSGFYLYNNAIYKFMFNNLKDYLKKCYKHETRLCIMIFSLNTKNNTYSLISDINQIDFNPYSNDDLNFVINKSIVIGNKNILIVVKEI
jgi:hypothetical protein